MEKQKMMKISFWIFAMLLFCTVVSIWIQELMRNEVTVLSPAEERKMQGLSFPAKCLCKNSDGMIGVWEVVREEEAMGEQLRVHFREVQLISQDETTAVILDEGYELLIVDYIAYPLEEAMVVEIISSEPEEQAMKSQLDSQKKNLYQLAFFVLIYFIAIWIANYLLKGIFHKKLWQAVLGIGILLVAAYLVYHAMGAVDIPREYLPEEQIFDIKFYLENQ